MRKLLFVPLSLIMTIALAQNPSTEKKRPTTSVLDGKNYKITLSTTSTSTLDKDVSNDQIMAPSDKTGAKTTEQNQSMNESLANKTAVLRFENGMIITSLTAMKSIESCPYTITSPMDQVAISFTATCKSSASSNLKKNCAWAGTVDGKTIKGTLGYSEGDGKLITYTFNGIETDNSKDMGVK